MVNATNPDGKQFRHNKSGRQDGEKTTRMMALQQRMKQTGDQRNGIYEIQDHTNRSTTTMDISTHKSERQV